MEKESLNKRRIVVIGGSAGSLEGLIKIISFIPPDTTSSVIVVIHRKNSNDSLLPKLLASKTKLIVKEVEDKESISQGHIYIAPPDYHLLIEDRNNFSLDVSDKVQFSRPSIDVTFESAAEVFESDLIGILLSGANADGSEGLNKIVKYGGYAIVQDPLTADVPFMPEQAIASTTINMIADADKIGRYLKEILK